jgi:hypothetical protein
MTLIHPDTDPVLTARRSGTAPANDATALFLIPETEWARSYQWERGHKVLRRGLQESRAWKEEEWGNALTRLWRWVLQEYNRRTR